MAAKTVAILYATLANPMIRQDLNNIPKNLAFSLNTGFRLGCLDLCEACLPLMSSNFFKNVLIEPFLLMGKDKCPNVLLRFLELAPRVSYKIPYKEKPKYDKLVSLIADLLKYKLAFIAEKAKEVHETITDSYFR